MTRKFKLRITGDLGFEVWADIPGYEGLYQASTYGQIRSLDRLLSREKRGAYLFKGQILKPIIDKLGYNRVELSDNLHNKKNIMFTY